MRKTEHLRIIAGAAMMPEEYRGCTAWAADEIDRLTTEIEELKESEKARVETYVKSCAEWQETINTLRAKLATVEKAKARKQGRIDEMYEERSLLILEKGALRAESAALLELLWNPVMTCGDVKSYDRRKVNAFLRTAADEEE